MVADTPDKRARGLMHVTDLPAGEGMLFVFDSPGHHCMWMKNTLIPLTVVYLDGDRKIIDQYDMTPHDETLHCTKGLALYAIEVNTGQL